MALADLRALARAGTRGTRDVNGTRSRPGDGQTEESRGFQGPGTHGTHEIDSAGQNERCAPCPPAADVPPGKLGPADLTGANGGPAGHVATVTAVSAGVAAAPVARVEAMALALLARADACPATTLPDRDAALAHFRGQAGNRLAAGDPRALTDIERPAAGLAHRSIAA